MSDDVYVRLREFLDNGPVPVVDGGGRLVGLVVGGSVTR